MFYITFVQWTNLKFALLFIGKLSRIIFLLSSENGKTKMSGDTFLRKDKNENRNEDKNN